jgi:hypothetical protein
LPVKVNTNIHNKFFNYYYAMKQTTKFWGIAGKVRKATNLHSHRLEAHLGYKWHNLSRLLSVLFETVT